MRGVCKDEQTERSGERLGVESRKEIESSSDANPTPRSYEAELAECDLATVAL
jgi:hypothetical protein